MLYLGVYNPRGVVKTCRRKRGKGSEGKNKNSAYSAGLVPIVREIIDGRPYLWLTGMIA
jgi:hypothetical protein